MLGCSVEIEIMYVSFWLGVHLRLDIVRPYSSVPLFTLSLCIGIPFGLMGAQLA